MTRHIDPPQSPLSRTGQVRCPANLELLEAFKHYAEVFTAGGLDFRLTGRAKESSDWLWVEVEFASLADCEQGLAIAQFLQDHPEFQ